MKKLLIAFAMLLLLLAFSCSDDDKKDGTKTSTVSDENQEEVAIQVTGQVDDSFNQLAMATNGLQGNFYFAKSGDGKNPPEYWESIGDGWYQYTGEYFGENFVYKTRYSPDIWATQNPNYDDVTKFESILGYEYEINYNGSTVSSGFNWETMCEYEDEFRNSVNGYNNLSSYASNSYEDYNFHWNITFDGVSIEPDDYTSHFIMDCTYPYYDGQGQDLLYTEIDGEFKFAADGTGVLSETEQYLAGTVKSNNILFIKYYSNGSSFWYTLELDDFASQYPWYPWYGVKE
ncbi:MAG: hypothetical protein JXR48_01290 [Candidatus Delongbacteria bacterium]|nr:hypothetical protein [Candidatus Delongbacteria bacterium]MBN2833578.1 hypothetical protein [Candidatus Delongbacteria bacterium]